MKLLPKHTNKAIQSLIALSLLSGLWGCPSNDTPQANTPSSNTASPTASSSAPPSTAKPSASPATKDTAKATKIDVKTKEMEFVLSSNSAPAGPVEFDIKNIGAKPHELIVFKTDLAIDKLPTKDGRLDEDAPSLKSLGEKEVKQGESATLKVNLTPGKYVLVCNLPGHFKQGMVSAFTVK